MIQFYPTDIPGLIIIEPQVFTDERGFFMETYSEELYRRGSINVRFVQDNHSKSSKGVLRWLHFQSEYPQAKLVRVTRGSVYDVAVDLRIDSPTFWQWHGVLLSALNKLQFFVPAWFAHGFLTLEDDTEFLYKCSDYYDKVSEGGISYDDPTLAIDWTRYLPKSEFLISEKDNKLQSFLDFQTNNPF